MRPDRFHAGMTVFPSIITATAMSPRHTCAIGTRAENICSLRAFLWLTDGVEKALAVNSE
jgi:hypothetical protein